MRIITNTASLFTPEEGEKMGISVIPVFVSIDDKSMRDYLDIGSDEFAALLREGKTAVSSQPAVGDVLDLLEDHDEETIMLTVADGLSGEYMTAMGVRNNLPHKDNVYVINSGSLAGPLRYMTKKAIALREQGMSIKEIVHELEECVRSSRSYVIPADFQYLKRSGRITNFTAKIGGALNLHPVLTQSEDKRRITLVKIRRTLKAAVAVIMSSLKDAGVDENFLISVDYADKPELAKEVRRQIKVHFPDTESEILQLSPSLITHGGPGCIVVQAVRK